MSRAKNLRLGLLVTGTDTGAGKTLVTAGLLAGLRAMGYPVTAMKPVESGTEESDGVPADAALLAICAGVEHWSEVNVTALREPLAPSVAAAREGTVLSIHPLDDAVAAVPQDRALIVEGVGGALVEVADGVMVADLPVRWGLAALVVAANRLGVLNHAMLTVDSLRSRQAAIAGVVLNTVHGGEPTVAEQTNAAELARLLPADVPFLGTIPFVPEAERGDAEALAAATHEVTISLLAWTR